MADSGKIDPPARLAPVKGLRLELGLQLRAPLYDEHGNLLLARHQVIDTPRLLNSLREHPALFTDEQALRDTVRVVMASFEEAYRRDAPLSRLPHAGVTAMMDEPDIDPETLAAVNKSRLTQSERAVPPHELWTNLEHRLGGLLASIELGGTVARDALTKLVELQATIERALQTDLRSALVLMFNRAVSGFTGYCALHSLQCAVVAWDVARRLPVSADEAQALVRAALTMNASIKTLQDQMAVQRGPASREQLAQIDRHSVTTVQALENAGATDPMWLEVIARHHDTLPYCAAINDRPPAEKLAKILQVIDRFTAALSPRGSRPARSAKEAVKSVIREHAQAEHDEVGLDLMMNLGLYPPGTYVKLERGEVGVGLIRGFRPDNPWVAIITNRAGEPVIEPKVIQTSEPGFSVVQGLAGSMVRVKPNEATLLKALGQLRSSVRR